MHNLQARWCLHARSVSVLSAHSACNGSACAGMGWWWLDWEILVVCPTLTILRFNNPCRVTRVPCPVQDAPSAVSCEGCPI